MNDMGDYHDHCWKKYVLLLADVLEKVNRHVYKILQTRSLSLF